MKADVELRAFARLIEALDSWLDQVAIIGGWAHRLYRLHPRAQPLPYPPLTTFDSDVAVPPWIEAKETSIRERLLAAGFQEEFVGEDRPPATHYRLGEHGGFYVEFLTPLVGGEYSRKGERRATTEVAGISSQRLRYVDILLLAPWSVRLDEAGGYPLAAAKYVRIANPVSFITQKILIQPARDRKDRAKDVLYIHDTIETFATDLAELREVFANQIRPKLHARNLRKVRHAATEIFGAVNDNARDAVLMATGRELVAEALVETCRSGLNAIFI
jgi:hypothetical protein